MFASWPVLRVVKGILLKLLDVGPTGDGSTGRDPCDVRVVCRIAVLSLHWLDDRVIQIHYQILVDGVFVWGLGVADRLHVAAGLGSALVECHSVGA